jgi:hypothetical protein
MLQDRFDMSERRACRIVGQHRSTQRRELTRGTGDDALRKRLHEFSRKHKPWGYSKAHAGDDPEPYFATSSSQTNAGVPTARGSSACGGRRPSRSSIPPASDSASGSRTVPPIAFEQSTPITCGRSTSSSTRPRTARS